MFAFSFFFRTQGRKRPSVSEQERNFSFLLRNRSCKRWSGGKLATTFSVANLPQWNQKKGMIFMAKTDSEKAYLTLIEDLEQSKTSLKEEKEGLLNRLQEIDESLAELDKQSKILGRKYASIKKREEELQELIRSFDLAPKKRKRKTKNATEKQVVNEATSESFFPSEPTFEEEMTSEPDSLGTWNEKSSFESEY